ncbi:MAG: hypothetical protein M3321_01455 [Actinomycetota bacterium]|nr:hypothetical protein [Actinomycetota bacterium]
MTAAVRALVALGAICTLVFPAGAASVATPTNFRFTTPVPLEFVQFTPHVAFFFAEPVETRVPRVGRATVDVDFSTCSPYPCEPTGTASMRATITASGGTLVLSGGSNSHDEVSNTGTWTVTEATGRFEGYTGAGTYTWSWSVTPPPFGTASLSLVGYLGRE